MLKTLIVATFVLLSVASSFGQSQDQRDSLIAEICKTMVNDEGLPDTTILQHAFVSHVYPFLENYPPNERKALTESIFIRLQRNCKEFRTILNRINPPKGDWATVDEKPKTLLDKESCREFLNHTHYVYLEASGDTVNVQIKDGFWVESFKDRTYSKLKLNWINDCEFELAFIESNNAIRKNFSKPGDKYNYQVLDKNEKYYSMSAEISGTGKFLTFKIYYH